MNKIIVIGNLVDNPKSRIVNSEGGQLSVCNFTVAANRIVKGKRVAEYFNISCWGGRAENAMKFLSKGSKVYVSGPVSAHAYASRNGALQASLEVTAEEIEYLSSRRAAETPPPAPDQESFMHIPEGIDSEVPFA